MDRSYDQLVQDIEDLENIERLLRKSKAWFKAIFEGSSIGIAILNMSGIIIEMNPAMEKILGYETQELRSIGIENIGSSTDHGGTEDAFKALYSGVTRHFEEERSVVRKDGETAWVNLKGTHVQNTGEDFEFILVMIEDITERKLNEQRQERLMQELTKSNQELDNFAYIVSHDLKAPLRGIGSLVSWISSDYGDKLDEDGKEIISLLNNRVERMKNFIDGILEYSRAARKRENKSEVNLNKLLADILDIIVLPENIRVLKAKELPVVICERLRMEQVLANLVGNAVKYSDKPEGQITVDYEDLGDAYCFSVSDNGPGIEEKYFEKIFQIFQTLAPRDKIESTGIGLSIVKKIVEGWGGKVWLKSEMNMGTTFYFTLPK